MTRDMELIRAIIKAVQSRKDTAFKRLVVDGYDENTVARHAELLIEAKFLKGDVKGGMSGVKMTAFVNDLTWEGHELAAALANEGVWSDIKKKFSPAELAALPLSVLKAVAIGLVQAYAMHQAGLR